MRTCAGAWALSCFLVSTLDVASVRLYIHSQAGRLKSQVEYTIIDITMLIYKAYFIRIRIRAPRIFTTHQSAHLHLRSIHATAHQWPRSRVVRSDDRLICLYTLVVDINVRCGRLALGRSISDLIIMSYEE